MRSITANAVRQIRELPSPKGHLLLGQLPAFQQGPKHSVLETWANECGSIYRIRLGLTPFVVSTDPDFNGKILKLRPEGFQRHPKISEILEEIGVYSVFNAEGGQWYHHRKPVAEALNLRKVKSFYPLLHHKTEQLLHRCQRAALQQHKVEVRSLIQRFTLDVTTVIAFGYPLNTLKGEEDELHCALQLVFPTVNRRMSAALPTWRWWKSKADRDFEKALHYIRSAIHSFIEKARQARAGSGNTTPSASNFLASLLAEQETNGLSDGDVFSAVFTLLLAGEDTTANSNAWALIFLAQHPEVVDEVRTEAQQVYGNAMIPRSVADHQQLKKAEAVAQETIRLKPTSPQLILRALERQVIQGVELPKGTNVILQNRRAQSYEAFFSKADQFLPKRWELGGCPAGWKHQADVVRTFGGGARFCPGKHLALHEMVIVISSLCKCFDFELIEPASSIAEAYTFTMHPEQFH